MKPAVVLVVCLLPLLGGCTFGEKPAPRQGPVEVGHYPAPPVGVARPRVAVAPFHVTIDRGFAGDVDLSEAAADQMMQLLDATARFNLIERVRLGQMLREHNLTDVLEPGEWARPVALPGVSYIVIGRVLSLSATAEDPAASFGVPKVQQMVGMGDDKNHRVNITISCNIDVRLVDPATGNPRIDIPRTYRRTASAATFGFDLGDRDVGTLALKQTDAAAILRIILDDEIRQMLPQVDAMLQAPPQQPTTADANSSSAPPIRSTSAPLSAPSTLRRICPECGADVSIYDEFCPNCGARLPHLGGPATQPAQRTSPNLVK